MSPRKASGFYRDEHGTTRPITKKNVGASLARGSKIVKRVYVNREPPRDRTTIYPGAEWKRSREREKEITKFLAPAVQPIVWVEPNTGAEIRVMAFNKKRGLWEYTIVLSNPALEKHEVIAESAMYKSDARQRVKAFIRNPDSRAVRGIGLKLAQRSIRVIAGDSVLVDKLVVEKDFYPGNPDRTPLSHLDSKDAWVFKIIASPQGVPSSKESDGKALRASIEAFGVDKFDAAIRIKRAKWGGHSRGKRIETLLQTKRSNLDGPEWFIFPMSIHTNEDWHIVIPAVSA